MQNREARELRIEKSLPHSGILRQGMIGNQRDKAEKKWLIEKTELNIIRRKEIETKKVGLEE